MMFEIVLKFYEINIIYSNTNHLIDIDVVGKIPLKISYIILSIIVNLILSNHEAVKFIF